MSVISRTQQRFIVYGQDYIFIYNILLFVVFIDGNLQPILWTKIHVLDSIALKRNS